MKIAAPARSNRVPGTTRSLPARAGCVVDPEGQPDADEGVGLCLLCRRLLVAEDSAPVVEDVPFRVLAAGNEPALRTTADFCKRHFCALQGFFEQGCAWLVRWTRRPSDGRHFMEQGQSQHIEAQDDE
jgi:hypothetical protein